MGRFSVNSMRYLDPDHFRVLLAVEMGMKNHEFVPLPLISSIAAIHRGATTRWLSDLAKLSLVCYERGKRFDGYRLTTLGYDFLALRALCSRDVVGSVGNQIGIGKESDVYVGGDPELNDVVLKFHRLGRTCFRKLKEKRDYHQRRHYCSWLYLSRISALKEFTFLKTLYSRKFPVPQPIDVCRHTVVMSLIDGLTLCHVDTVKNPGKLFDKLMSIIVRLANHGLIHGDFNEFNVMLTENEEPLMIDFPQMVSIDHPNAEFYFNRDVDCVRTFFRRKFGFDSTEWPKFSEVERRHNLDIEVAASGFTKKMARDLNKAYDEGNFDVHEDDESEEDEDEDDTENEVELDEDAREAEYEKRRLARENRFSNWIERAQAELEKTVGNDLECPQLVEMDEQTSAKYKEAYEKVKIEAKKYEDEDEINVLNDSENEEEHEKLENGDKKKNSKPENVKPAKSVYSNGSTIAPDEIKRRLLKEKGQVKKERLKAKGKQCAVNRNRRDNMHVIKEHEGWDVY